MERYIALIFSALLIAGGFYALTLGHPYAGGWVIFFGLIFGWWCVSKLLRL
jgi:hypothetical protein